MHAAVTFCLMLIKFVSLTSQSITKFVNTDVQRRVSVYFGGNIFNIKLTIVAAQKLYTMHTRNENHALDSRTSWLHCACEKGREKGKRRGPSWLGVLFSYLDIYLTNSACVGLRMFFFQLEYGIYIVKHKWCMFLWRYSFIPEMCDDVQKLVFCFCTDRHFQKISPSKKLGFKIKNKLYEKAVCLRWQATWLLIA